MVVVVKEFAKAWREWRVRGYGRGDGDGVEVVIGEVFRSRGGNVVGGNVGRRSGGDGEGDGGGKFVPVYEPISALQHHAGGAGWVFPVVI